MKSRPDQLAIQRWFSSSIQHRYCQRSMDSYSVQRLGTPVVPIRKPLLSEDDKPNLRVCGYASVTVNPQLAVHRNPLSLPTELMRQLGGGYIVLWKSIQPTLTVRSSATWSKEQQMFGSQYAQKCTVLKCFFSIWNFISSRLLPEDHGWPHF